jgi:hypothetical protein
MVSGSRAGVGFCAFLVLALVEIELLVQLEVELSGARFINMAIAERMPGKINKITL